MVERGLDISDTALNQANRAAQDAYSSSGSCLQKKKVQAKDLHFAIRQAAYVQKLN